MFRFLFSKAFLINLLAALLLICLIIWGIFKYLDSYTNNGKTISVPQLEGLTLAEAEETLKEKKLRFQILDSIYVESAERGVVLEQNPVENDLVKENRTIYITISKVLAPKISVPDVIDMSHRLATAKIESYGLKIGELSYQPSECVNCVIDLKHKGKSIKPNDKIEKGSVLDIVLGSGTSSEQVMAPYLIGLSKEDAIKSLQSSFLNMGAEIYNDCETKEDSLNAKIYKQSPKRSENVIVNMGTSVDVWFTSDTSKIKINRPVEISDSTSVNGL